MPAIRRSISATLALASLLGACGGDVAGPDGLHPGLNLLPYANVVDTVGARPTAPLVVEYRGTDGTPVAGVDIKFEAPDVKWSGFDFGPVLFVSNATGSMVSSVITVKTDAAGRAQAPIAFGNLARDGIVRVSAPTLGGVQAIGFTAKPGNPARILFSIADTVMPVDGSVALSATAADRSGNLRAEVVSLSIRRGNAFASLGSGTLVGVAFGQVVVQGSLPGVTDSVRVGIVPRARLAVAQPATNGGADLFLVETDMTARRQLIDPSSTQGPERLPAWSPNGARLVVQMYDQAVSHVFFVDTATRVVTRVVPYVTAARDEGQPTYSPDGQWVHYVATTPYKDEKLWRARVDGTLAEEISIPGGDLYIDASPSVSPDGSRVVYWTSRTSGSRDVPRLMTLRLGTTDTTDLNATGYFPKWSPTGSDILYRHEDTLKLVRSDGSNQRVLGLATGGYGGHPVWSPDGQYVLAQHVRGLQMIHVATGEIVQYPASTTGWNNVAWRP